MRGPARGSGISRRNFLRGAAALSALAGAQPLVATAAGDVSHPPAGAGKGPFVHGVASGDPLSDRVILWTRVTFATPPDEIPVDYVVATDPDLTNVVVTGQAQAKRHADYTVKVDVTGLSPGTTYYYRFSTRSIPSPIGRTRTLPVGSVDRLRLGVVSCASLAHGWFNAYRKLAKRADLDAVLHLGDYIYEFGDGEYGDLRGYEPPTEIVTLREYRTRHNQYKTDPDLKKLHRQHAIIEIWDDHEFADDAWQGGAANHQPGTEGAWTDRVAAALQAYYEWMPIRPVYGDRRRINRSFRFGDLAEVFMLEERLTARAEQAEPNFVAGTSLFTEEGEFLDKDRRIVSRAQQDWLVGGLRQTGAVWKLIGQGVMMAQARSAVAPDGKHVFFNHDQWDGYRPARNRLLSAIAADEPVRNAVVLTGDIHSSWAAELSTDPYDGRYDPATGEGSIAVEFIATSVTSPGFDDPDGQAAAGLQALNPHIKYIDLARRGYVLLDVTSERTSAEWWYVSTIEERGGSETFGAAFETPRDSNRVLPGTQSLPRPDAPPLAP